MWLSASVFTAVLAFLLSASAALAADDSAPPPPKPDDRGRPPFARGAGQGHGFGFGGGERGMDQLTDEEKKRLREAVEKVWANPDVANARDRVMKANEEFRSTLRGALQKSDPDVVAILEKAKIPMPWEQHRNSQPLPRADDPNFPRLMTARLGLEMASLARPEQREAFRHLHERVIEMPEVKDAITKVQTAPPEGRMEAFKNLRSVYKQECERAIAEFRRKHAGEPGKNGTLASPSSAPQ